MQPLPIPEQPRIVKHVPVAGVRGPTACLTNGLEGVITVAGMPVDQGFVDGCFPYFTGFEIVAMGQIFPKGPDNRIFPMGGPCNDPGNP